MADLPSLSELVAALPEIYQPIYGHAEFDSRAARQADEGRLEQILAVHKALADHLGRPVRVLDLGCAQGWFGFNLAKAGAEVLGIDLLAANINVCNMLVLENRGLKARFKLAEAENISALVTEQSFDLVLGLSVLHHLCFHNGKEATREFVKALFEKIPSGIFELALASEPVKWAPALPEDPAYLIDHAPFHLMLSEHATHLSPIKRPLYFCSRLFWYLGGAMTQFQSWHGNDRGRSYFFAKDSLAKLYRTTGEFADANRNAIRGAVQFLQSPPAGYPSPPKLRQTGEAFGQAWLVQDKIEGEAIDSLMHAKKSYDPRAILTDVLRALAALESAGLYHGDLRTWNVLLDGQGRAHLIDYNAITNAQTDCIWPWRPFLAFFLFAHEIILRQPATFSQPARPPFISPYNLPEPYRSWGAALWARPVTQWRFAGLLESLQRLPSSANGAVPAPDPSALIQWMESMEQFMNLFAEKTLSYDQPIGKLLDIVMTANQAMNQRILHLEAIVGQAQKRASGPE